ncbi:hypothetical protein K504DRAFT_267052 [Pleomassaria siparia CBS 279.74]|uniref:Uncharacterized protein n=1 Tax=Pleomassaria siparia CBS 279.74 TaxID=1314801 RepID=A0A6G1KDT8_9PLEO|nr:hypothetical protein K504DRAFT_267052 [Pleomassaria siparia CBS 279.74]
MTVSRVGLVKPVCEGSVYMDKKLIFFCPWLLHGWMYLVRTFITILNQNKIADYRLLWIETGTMSREIHDYLVRSMPSISTSPGGT